MKLRPRDGNKSNKPLLPRGILVPRSRRPHWIHPLSKLYSSYPFIVNTYYSGHHFEWVSVPYHQKILIQLMFPISDEVYGASEILWGLSFSH